MPPCPFVAYYRVSTMAQGRSGLGLEAQQDAVRRYLDGAGGTLVAAYTETESGKRSDRPQLAAALERCRREKATLVIAKLDRLARNTRFLLGILESRVDTVFCDLPHIPDGAAGKFMLTQFAAIAELEAGLISERTKAALQAAKARGQSLGNPRLDEINNQRRAAADAFAREMAPIVAALRAEGFSTLEALTGELNRRSVPTAGGGRWHLPTVHRLVRRLARLEEANARTTTLPA